MRNLKEVSENQTLEKVNGKSIRVESSDDEESADDLDCYNG